VTVASCTLEMVLLTNLLIYLLTTVLPTMFQVGLGQTFPPQFLSTLFWRRTLENGDKSPFYHQRACIRE